MAYRCETRSGELQFVDTRSGNTVWHGKPDGYPVWQTLPVPGSDDCLVLLEYWARAQHGFQNLLRVRPDGAIVWRAELPDPRDDAYVGFRWIDQTLSAGSWSGYQVVLDPHTGRICSMSFTK